MPRQLRNGGVTFEGTEPSSLERVSVVAQCLDNQWVPRQLLKRMIDHHLTLDDVRAERERSMRTEYLRALVNAKQVVSNRAYLYNNPAVFRDYLQKGNSLNAFKALLSAGVIVPFLYSEQTPCEEPGFTTDPRGFSAWQQLCAETPMKCVRLAWDDYENQALIRDQLARRFHDFAATAYSGDMDVYVRDLKIDSQARESLWRRLNDLAAKCIALAGPNQHATREDLYREFVTVGKPAEGRYDSDKPFAAEIKQLLDLSYNTNLPDALGVHALTPGDSLPRTALQELLRAQQQTEVSAEQVMELLRRSAFALVQEGLYLDSLGSLSLEDVEEVRRTDEWARYIQSLEALLADPFSFADPEKGALAVYQGYVQLAGVMTKLVTAKTTQARAARWTPVVELVVNIAGAVLSVVWPGTGMVYKVAGAVSSRVGAGAARFVARLVIRGFAEQGAQADLVASVDFMRGRVHDARKQWSDLQDRLQKDPRFSQLPADLERTRDATINYPGEPNA